MRQGGRGLRVRMRAPNPILWQKQALKVNLSLSTQEARGGQQLKQMIRHGTLLAETSHRQQPSPWCGRGRESGEGSPLAVLSCKHHGVQQSHSMMSLQTDR